MANEVMIIVRSKNDVKQGFDSSKRELETFADQSGDTYNKRFGAKMSQMGNVIAAPLARAGQQIGDKLGERAGDQFLQDMTKTMGLVDQRTAAASVRAGEQIGQRIGNQAGDEVVKAISVNIGKGGAEIVSASEGTGTEIGDAMGERASDRITEKIDDSLGRGSRGRFTATARATGDQVGETMGENIGQKIVRKIREALARRFSANVDADVNTKGSRSTGLSSDKNQDSPSKGFSGAAEKVGRDIGDKVGGGIGQSLQTFFSGDFITFMVKGISIAAVAAALAPILGGAVISAFGLAFGGGILAAGIISALRDPAIKGAIGDLKKQATGLFEAFGRPFRAPLADFLEKLSRFLSSKQVISAAKELSAAFAPIVGELGTGLISMLQNMLPGFVSLAKAAVPMFETLAKHLPAIGRALSRMFQAFADQGDDANVFFSDLLHFIEATIVILGKLIAAFASAYSALRNFVVNGIQLIQDLGTVFSAMARHMKAVFLTAIMNILNMLGVLAAGAADAFGWIPGIGGKLRAAQNKFNEFRKGVNNELNKINNKTVTVTIRQVFTTIGRIAVQAAGIIAGRKAAGGIVGAVGQAASGGIRNGLTLVGENGPELADLAPGTRVHSNGDSKRMLGGQGGGGTMVLKLEKSGNAVLDELFRWLLEHLQSEARTQYRNDANLMFGGTR